MNRGDELKQGLEQLRTLAAEKRNRVTVGEILAAFPTLEMSRERVAAIYDYLAGEGITVEDYVPHDTESMTVGEAEERSLLGGEEDRMDEEEKQVYEMYLEDLASVPPLGTEEEQQLLRQLAEGSPAGKKAAKDRLAEGNLRWVLKLAKQHSGLDVPLGDLIQEGNMALLTGLQEYTGTVDWADFLEDRIRSAMRELIREQNGYDRMEERLTGEANRILELTQKLEEEENRAISVEEISEQLKLPRSRVEEVLRESARAILNAQK